MPTPPCQPTILAPPPLHARFLTFGLVAPGAEVAAPLDRLAAAVAGTATVVGLGAPLVARLGAEVAGLRPFPALCGPGVAFPSTQGAAWAYVASASRGEGFERARGVIDALGPDFRLEEEVDAFQYGGRDLTGYEDGTENPKGEAALAAALVQGRGPGWDGGSFVAVQKYRHALGRFAALPPEARDQVIGRARATNEELADAPASAHVKRTAQESFTPEAFVLRRSLPWGSPPSSGLYFVAFGESLDRFERQLRRMAGLEDGLVDALLGFSQALSGGYYWCPPIEGGRLDLRGLTHRSLG